MALPRLAITLGDPAGIGPEVVVAAWRDERVWRVCRPVVFGHPENLRRAAQLLGIGIEVVEVARVGEVDWKHGGTEGTETRSAEGSLATPDRLVCVRCCGNDAVDAPAGMIDARGGRAAYDALIAAADAAIAADVEGIVTAPLSKAALWQAGHRYPGHTEILAARCGVPNVAMMLYLGASAFDRRERGLGVVHVTLHTALANVFGELSADAIVAKARLADGIMERLDGTRPRIGVCALNPHAGEEGLFGDEERRIIAPAVAVAKQAGLTIEGPIPADTLFVRAREGEFDAVVAMYHDQGHIALKLMGMRRAVNITLGLPIVRTSVAHGTAFDIAWQGRADHGSLIEAILAAAKLTRREEF